MRLRWKYHTIKRLITADTIIMKRKALFVFSKGTGTFIPKKDATKVGTIKMIVTKVKR